MCTSHCLTLTAFINEQIGFFLPRARLQIDEKYLQKSWSPSPPPSPLLLYGPLHKKLICSPFLVAMCLISHTLMFLLPCVMHFPQSIFTPLSSALLSWLRTSHKNARLNYCLTWCYQILIQILKRKFKFLCTFLLLCIFRPSVANTSLCSCTWHWMCRL